MAEGKEKGFFKRLVEGLSQKQGRILFRELIPFSAVIPALMTISARGN